MKEVGTLAGCEQQSPPGKDPTPRARVQRKHPNDSRQNSKVRARVVG